MEEHCVQLKFDSMAIRIILDAVTHEIERWPGGPAQEQENLKTVQTVLQQAMLELRYLNDK